MGLVMAERPEHETGPRKQATVYPPAELWRLFQIDALTRGTTASAIVTEYLSEYLALNDEERAAVAARSQRWVRPKGGAARGDGDSV